MRLVNPALIIVLLAATTLALGGCDSARSQRSQGVRDYNAGDYGRANMHLTKAAETQPTDFRNQYMLGMNQLARNKPQKAQIALERALELQPNSRRWTPKIRTALAESLYRQKRFDALHAFIAKTASDAGTTHAYLRKARYLRKMGDRDGAAKAYQTAAAVSRKGDPRAYVRMADYYKSINDQARAIQALRNALYIDPDNGAVVDRLRQYGITPGPTAARKPPEARPELRHQNRRR